MRTAVDLQCITGRLDFWQFVLRDLSARL